MRTQEITQLQTFDQEASIQNAFETVLQLGKHAINFASIERAPRYTHERHENDAEHSFMLGLIAPELATQLRPELETGLVAQFAIVHDLVELETGDTVTFALDTEGIVQKERAEHTARERLTEKLPPHTASMLLRYESQTEPEARFVRLVDKLLPLLANIYGPGKQVMTESFGIQDVGALAATESACNQRLTQKFPDPELAPVHAVRRLLAQHFQGMFDVVV